MWKDIDNTSNDHIGLSKKIVGKMPYTIGLDFGTYSLRALIVDVDSGEEVGMSVA